jgi:hypothetical protein
MGKFTVRTLTLSVLSAAAIAIMAPANPASADTPSLVKNRETQDCLHHNGSGSVIVDRACALNAGGNYWHVHEAEEYENPRGRTRIISSSGGRCLTTILPPINDRYEVKTERCREFDELMQWRWRPNADGNQVQNVSTLQCLDANDPGNVYTHSCNDGLFQRWQRLRP